MTATTEKPINVVKQIAEEFLPGVLKGVGVEDTPANREDILALALNKLPQKYVTSVSGRLYAEAINNFRAQYQTDVLSVLTKAAITVKKRPRGIETTSREEQ